MHTARVWVHAHDARAEPGAARLVEELSLQHVAADQRRPWMAHDAGVVLFSRFTDDLVEFVRESSAGGRRRLIGVAVDEELETTWLLLHAGASDVLSLQQDWNALARAVTARVRRWSVVNELLASDRVREACVGESPEWLRILRQVVELARFTSAPVLVQGESGTGKEMIAQLIHHLDDRVDKGRLVTVDCTTIVPTLSGSEFFGHVRGAFTGASTDRDGACALADGGTLFLDEVGELPLGLQAELLRVVQEKSYKRVGGNTWYRSDFRLVCATNRDLLAEQRAGRFRHDLYHRLAGWTCTLPPLRQRVDDILPLARHFMRQLRPDTPVPEFAPAVRQFLTRHSYPGNVRELKQLVSRLMLRYCGVGPLTPGCLPEEDRPAASEDDGCGWDLPVRTAVFHALQAGISLKELRRLVEHEAVTRAVAGAEGNLQRAARALGMTDRALQLRMAARRRDLRDHGERVVDRDSDSDHGA